LDAERLLEAWRRFLDHLKPDDAEDVPGAEGKAGSRCKRVSMYHSALEWLATRVPVRDWLSLLPGKAALGEFIPAMERAFAHHDAPGVRRGLAAQCDAFHGR